VKLLDRYLLALLGRIFVLSLAAFVGIYLLVDFFERIDDFIEHQALLAHYVLYFTSKIPLIVVQVTPMAVLMGVFLALGGLARSNELTAMRACGISLWRITTPLLIAGLLGALTVLAVSEYVVPLSVRKINHILHTEVKGKPEPVLKRDRLWLREGNTIVNIRLALPERGTLQGITIFTIDESFRLLRRTDAARATHGPRGWALEDATVLTFDPASGRVEQTEHLATLDSGLTRSPADFQSSERLNEELGFRELRRLARRLQEEGYDAVRYRVDMHARLATPFASLIMAFLGIPFALQKKRGASLAMGITLSVAIGITYHIVQAMLLAFGYSAALPPVVAAWAPNLLFLLLGVWMMLMVRE
jgi:lipopolysaccharide export system permease protein